MQPITPKLSDIKQSPFYFAPKFTVQQFSKNITSSSPKLAQIQQERIRLPLLMGHDKGICRVYFLSHRSLFNGSCSCSHLCKGQSVTQSLCSHAKSGQINQAASMCSLERTMCNIHQSHFFNRLPPASQFALCASERAAAAATCTSKVTSGSALSDNTFLAAHDLMD